MLTKSSVFAVLAVGLIAGCAAKNRSNAGPTGSPRIAKGTPAQPQIASQNDQILLAFNEIGWSRQSASLAVNPPNLSSHEGCVNRLPQANESRFLTEIYNCDRTSDESDPKLNQRVILTGTQYFSLRQSRYLVTGSFNTQAWDKTNPTLLLTSGTLSRSVGIDAPIGVAQAGSVEPQVLLQASVFKLSSMTTYRGDLPDQSTDLNESWTASLTGGFTAAPARPLTLNTGTQITVSYLPQVPLDTKRTARALQLVAKTDVRFEENEDCLRPVGTFDLNVDSTHVATLVAAANGFQLSTENPAVVHSWGKRCLDH